MHHPQDRLLDAIAFAHEEVELDAGKQSHEHEYYDGIGSSGRATVDQNPRSERNIRIRLAKPRDREEGECGQVDDQTGADDEPLADTAQVILTDDREFAAGDAGPDGCKDQGSTT